MRVSCQIFNELADFAYLADSVWAIINASVPHHGQQLTTV
jgi:hypothetical protein